MSGPRTTRFEDVECMSKVCRWPECSCPVRTVQFCAKCRCTTWHVDGQCEWSDGHAPQDTPES